LGLAAYNAGVGNLMKSGKIASPYDKLSFPLQLTETRNYVDDILDGTSILKNVDEIASEVLQLDYEELITLVEQSCRLTTPNASNPKTVSTQVPGSQPQK